MAAYRSLYPEWPTDPDAIRVVRAPGRVNLIGEHTDYNDGLVLPAAIDLEVRIAYRPTDDRRASLTILATGETGAVDLDDPGSRQGDWRDYLAGVAWALASDGRAVQGFRRRPGQHDPGRGRAWLPRPRSSSRLAWALSGASAPVVDGRDLAVLCQRAENDYVGVRCGLMDQYAAANGVRDAALLLDCRARSTASCRCPTRSRSSWRIPASRAVSMPRPTTSGGRSASERRPTSPDREPSVLSLRDVDEAMLDRHRDVLDPTAYRRAMHVVTENARVLGDGQRRSSRAISKPSGD